jgi:hypothetical protein
MDLANFSMSKNKTLSLVAIIAALLSMMFISTANLNLIYAQNERFKAKLKGENEVPPVATSAAGSGKFRVKNDTITSNINITGITNVTAAHIHAGIKGQNGEPVVDLLKSGRQIHTDGGVIIKGEIADSDLQGSMAGKTLQDLKMAMKYKTVYVDVHTKNHPDGEIRGQINVCKCNATKAGSFDANRTSGI